MANPLRMLAPLVAVLAIAACGPTANPAVNAAITKIALQDILNSQLQASLNTPITLPVPAKIGILPYGYHTALHPEDEEAEMKKIVTALQAVPAVVSSAKWIDEGIAGSISTNTTTSTGTGTNSEGLRRLGASFGVDALVLIGGDPEWDQATSMGSWWDSWNHKAYYEARIKLTGVTMDVATGRYISPYTASGSAGPSLVTPDDNTSSSSAYGLKRSAESQALADLRTQVVHSLQDNAAQQAARAKASPTPSPAASSTAATGAASPAPTPTPRPSASASADAKATSEATATGAGS